MKNSWKKNRSNVLSGGEMRKRGEDKEEGPRR
jgi:hypothetical protein